MAILSHLEVRALSLHPSKGSICGHTDADRFATHDNVVLSPSLKGFDLWPYSVFLERQWFVCVSPSLKGFDLWPRPNRQDFNLDDSPSFCGQRSPSLKGFDLWPPKALGEAVSVYVSIPQRVRSVAISRSQPERRPIFEGLHPSKGSICGHEHGHQCWIQHESPSLKGFDPGLLADPDTYADLPGAFLLCQTQRLR